MGLFTPFTRRPRPLLLPIDPEEQRVLDQLRARREETRRRTQLTTPTNQGDNQ